jgi:membrane-bound lytic murein transglycosylase A
LVRAGSFARIGAPCLTALALAACATSKPEYSGRPVTRVADLPGWAGEDHLAVLAAYRDGCGVARAADAKGVCARARRFQPRGAAEARAFLEANFRVAARPGDGLLTAYFTPRYEARTVRAGAFSAPVRPWSGEDLVDALPDRKKIDAWPTDDALAWMRPEELFFMQLQGSAVLRFPDGRTVKAVTVMTNDKPFVGVARVMRERGLLADNDSSGEAIMAWLAAHRGPEADEIMRQNPRYGFFALQPFDGTISGGAGVPLTPGRVIAVDLQAHPYGGLYWIDADAPALKGAMTAYRRAVMALDTGGAIKGDVRADLYLGQGDEAGREAGRVRHRLRLYELVPVR